MEEETKKNTEDIQEKEKAMTSLQKRRCKNASSGCNHSFKHAYYLTPFYVVVSLIVYAAYGLFPILPFMALGFLFAHLARTHRINREIYMDYGKTGYPDKEEFVGGIPKYLSYCYRSIILDMFSLSTIFALKGVAALFS